MKVSKTATTSPISLPVENEKSVITTQESSSSKSNKQNAANPSTQMQLMGLAKQFVIDGALLPLEKQPPIEERSKKRERITHLRKQQNLENIIQRAIKYCSDSEVADRADQDWFNNFINLGTVYETSSGNIPRQEYVYIKTEPGQGFYTWIDYNNNGIKEFNEFEIAIYKDQAEYLRVALPNITFISTQRAKWQQVFTINPSQWYNKTGIKKMLSHFYNQTNFVIDNEQERVNNSFNLNPFDIDESNLLGLNYSLRNSLYLNKNQNNLSFIFTYATYKNKRLYNIGNQENNTKLHQLEFSHKLSTFWLFDFKTNKTKDEVITENFTNQNYKIETYEFAPKFTFEYSKNHQFSFFYNYKNKENTVTNIETLQQQKTGSSYYYKSTKNSLIRAEFNLFHNDFTGNQNSPVAYQMLEGLQAGKNYTWSLVYQQKINSFINLNINYLGRKGENSNTIHTGSVQLRANF